MPRLPKPREHHVLSGATRKDPQRFHDEVPKSPHALGDPPVGMHADAVAAWHEVVAACAKGVLTGADRIIVEITSNLLAEYRQDPPGFRVGKYRVMISCLARLGMSPSDRTQLRVEKPRDARSGPRPLR
jgi:hypothetical protein